MAGRGGSERRWQWMKRPAFQFYPGDWQRDAALRSCSIGARGLWIEMLCIMHQATPYGHLVVNGRPIDAPTLARMVGGKTGEVGRWLGELENAGVFDMEGGTRVSRRMVRDETLRKVRAAGGKLGGNPALMDNHKVDDKVNHDANLPPTPSSSTSSSASRTTTANAVVAESGIPPCPHLEIIRLYHEHLPTAQQVNPELWKGARAKHLQARWRESPKRQTLAWWERFFRYCAESAFLTGQVPPKQGKEPFVLRLGWLVELENFTKTIEGTYNRERTAA